jgi:hypothetical protein
MMASDAKTPDGFSLRRWSRRKHEAAREALAKESPAPVPPAPEAPAATGLPANAAPRSDTVPPELPPVESLTPESDFTAFMQPNVDAGLRREALKKLFADPHFNVMDGLDVYIDDYTKPDPIPASVLERLAQSGFVRGLGAPPADEPAPPSQATTVAATDGAPIASSPDTSAPAPDSTPGDEPPGDPQP